MPRVSRIARSEDYNTGIIKFTVKSTGEILECDVNALSADIAKKAAIFGIREKVGKMSSGKEGSEILTSMSAEWADLLSGKFKLRSTEEKSNLSKSAIKEKLAGLTGKEAAMAAALLEKLGIKL
jgi:hypothetical protein